MLDSEVKVSKTDQALTLNELFAALQRSVWNELKTGGSIPGPRRDLQREHVRRIATVLTRPSPSTPADAVALFREEAKTLSARIRVGDRQRQPRCAHARAPDRIGGHARRGAEGAAGATRCLNGRAGKGSHAAGREPLELTLAPLDNHALAQPLRARSTPTCGRSRRRSTSRSRIAAAPSPSPARPRRPSSRAEALQRFYAQAEKPLSVDDIQLGLIEITTQRAPARPRPTRTRRPAAHAPRRPARPHAEPGRPISSTSTSHDITFGIGPAGTGKTYLAVACAVDALERDAVKRLVLVRPAVEAGERLGFLPGDLAQKVDPYLRPLYDALYDLMGFDKTGKLFERGTIEIAPLAYMRGRTLNHSFIILDEAQNTTPEQMKMFLTRIGFGTKAVITGDVTQIDLARGQKSGLIEADRILAGVRGIAFTRFTSADVVRHPLVQKIIDAYDRDIEARSARPRRQVGAPRRCPLVGAIRRRIDALPCPPRCAASPLGCARRATRRRHRALRRHASRAARSTPRYRGKDYATNVLTFVYDDDAPRAGDIVLCAPVVRKEADAQGKTLGGALRSPGRPRHAAPAGLRPRARRATRAVMEARETAILARLGVADPYADV